MRPSWKGTLQVGLAQMPARLYGSTQSTTPRRRMLRRGDYSTLKQQYVAEADGKKVERADTVKAVPVGDGTFVPVGDGGVAANAKVLNVTKFIPRTQMPTHLLKKRFVLRAEEGPDELVAAMAAGMRSTRTVGVGELTLRGVVSLAIVEAVSTSELVVWQAWWPEEARQIDLAKVRPSPQVKALAKTLIEQMTDKTHRIDGDTYPNRNRERIETALDGVEPVTPASSPDNVIPIRPDTMLSVLEASINKVKKGA